MPPMPPLRSALSDALIASSAMALVGTLAGAVRILPWLLEPHVPIDVALPFARGLFAVTLETALLVGWPVGWALACFRIIENGEARALQSLGESPEATVKRLAPQGAALALALATVALVCGSDANAPGRVATELVVGARASCAEASKPVTYVVPFTEMTWLCAPDREPRLAGKVPGAIGGAMMTAKSARIAGDFRSVELDDARLTVPSALPIAVHVGTLSVRGMAPWAHASTLRPLLRALLLALSAWSAASVGVYAVLRRAVRGRAGAIILGAAGPLGALGLMRLLERAGVGGVGAFAFFLVPLGACVCAGAAGAGLPRLVALVAWSLRALDRAATQR
jgi:hypothetical protein